MLLGWIQRYSGKLLQGRNERMSISVGENYSDHFYITIYASFATYYEHKNYQYLHPTAHKQVWFDSFSRCYHAMSAFFVGRLGKHQRRIT